MSTIRQKKLAKAIVEAVSQDKPPTKQELVLNAGYSENTADNEAKSIIESKGVQEELGLLGFDPETAKAIVGEILIGGENDNVKLKAADMVFKVHGTYAPEKKVTLNMTPESNEKIKHLADELRRIHGGGNT